ncbi:uncharacterized protein K452DRAFT_359261 [Neofusicoccum parvum]|nr:uncharacterized protein K452DRAFT_359261 [Neofusicoccum parvum]
MILLQHPTPQQSRQDGSDVQPEVLAKRFPLKEACRILAEDEDFEVTRNAPFRSQVGFHRFEPIYDEQGMALYDWDLPLFRTDSARTRAYTHTVDRVLTLKPALPIEIADTIESSLEEPEPLESLTDAPVFLKNDKTVLEVHALIPLSDVAATAAALSKQIQVTAPGTTAVIYPWKHPFLPASRRDFWRLWQRLVTRNERPSHSIALFLDVDAAPTPSSGRQDLSLIAAEWQTIDSPTLVTRMGVEHAVPVWRVHHSTRHGVSRPEHEGLPPEAVMQRERLVGPDARFFEDPPAWRPLTGAEGGASDDAHPVFFLTAGEDAEGRRPKDVMDLMMSEIDDPDEFAYPSPYVFVEWEREDDGGAEEMLEIGVRCHDANMGRAGFEHMIFVDRQTFEDKKVLYAKYERPLPEAEEEDQHREILADESLDEEAKYQARLERYKEGLKVTRTTILDCELHMIWMQLSTANSDWEEQFCGQEDEWEFYERRFGSDEEKRMAFETWDRAGW